MVVHRKRKTVMASSGSKHDKVLKEARKLEKEAQDLYELSQHITSPLIDLGLVCECGIDCVLQTENRPLQISICAGLSERFFAVQRRC